MKVRVSSLRFSDGQEVPIPAEGAVLLVGPNNAGKSQTLKDIEGLYRENTYRGRTLTSITGEKEVAEGIESWIESNVPQRERDGILRYQVVGWGEVSAADISSHWNRQQFGPLTRLFIFHGDGTSRLTAGDSQQNLDFSAQLPTHPVQRAYQEPALEAELDAESRAAFGMGVVVDRFGGSVISLRIGDGPEFEHERGRPTEGYLRSLKNLPKLEEQGDGVRSYLGLALHIAAGRHEILLIDEPEAFLHPPQARRLGSVLASKAREQQAFIATHSTDIVQGALEGGSAITIVRITRKGDVNEAAVLNDEAVKRLWSDPLLRYSNVLDGLFHDVVVLCESDADCRFYSAVLDNLDKGATQKVGDEPTTRAPQLLFTQCGGKTRIASVVDSLRAVSVPVVVVSDFDVLREARDVERIVTSLGGDYSSIAADQRIVSAALASNVSQLRKVTLRDEFNRRLDLIEAEVLQRNDVEGLRSLLRAESGWDRAKRAGLGAVPQGDEYRACLRLLEALQEIGFLVVPVGELERFAPEVSDHGPKWITAVLEQKLHEHPGNSAVDFVTKIRDTAANALR